MLTMTEKMSPDEKRRQIMHAIEMDYDRLENSKQILHGQNVIERRILLLGRSKSGKTTLRQMLRNPTKVSGELTLLSKSSSLEYDVIESNKSDVSLTILDTQSLSGRPYDDENQLSHIREAALTNDINSYHFICYCISFEAGIRHQDISAMKAIIACYGENIKSNSCLIITRCESKSEEQRNRMLNQIERDMAFKDLIQQCQLGLHFSGALNYDNWQNGNEILLDEFKNIYDYREKLFEFFHKSVTPCSLQAVFKNPATPPFTAPTVETFRNDGYPTSRMQPSRSVCLISIMFRQSTVRSHNMNPMKD